LGDFKLERNNRNIYIFYAIALLQGMVFYGPIATLYRQAQGLSVFDITIIESISLVVMITLEVPWGYLADRIGYKRTILICNILYFISKIVFWKADGFVLFLAERLILSVVLSGLSGCDSAYLYLSAGERDSQKVFGIYDAMYTVGLFFASIIFSVIVKNDYELSAFLTVVSYGIAMVLSLVLTEVKPKPSEHTSICKQFKVIASSMGENKGFILFLLAAALLAESSQTITVFLSQLQYLRSGILPQHMGYIFIIVTAAGLLSGYSYMLTAWLGEARTIKLLFSVACLSCAIVSLLTHPIIAVFGIVLLRASASLLVPLRMGIQNRQIKIPDRATMLSIYSIIMNMTAVGTNLVFGKLADINIKYAMTGGTLFCIIGLMLYIVWQSKTDIKI
jgi:MFS family permease